MVRSDSIQIGLLSAAVCFLIAIAQLSFHPVFRLQSKYGSPASVTIYGIADVAGVVVVCNGIASKVLAIDGSGLNKIRMEANQAKFWNLPLHSELVDPRFAASDTDEFILEGWLNGKCHRLECDSSDPGAIGTLARHFLELAQTQHHYECS